MAIQISESTVIDNTRKIVNVATGSSTAPSITPTSDTNTGIYFPSADTLSFSTGGVLRLNIDTNVTTDGQFRELYNGTYWNVVTQADVGYGASQVPLNQYLGQLAFLDDFSPNALRREGGGSDDVVVNSLGFVGVGTTNPSSLFTVVGDANITGVATVGLLTATNIWNAGITTSGKIVLTATNSGATGGGQIYLNGASGNRIDFNTNGIAAPTFTTRSAGTKLVLYPNISGSRVDYALGIESSTLWYSVDQSSSQHRWYAGTTQLADLKGTGELVIGSTSLTGTASQRLQVTGGAYVSGDVGIGNTNPQRKFHLRATGSDGVFLDNSDQTGNSGGPVLRVRGQRVDSNTTQGFSGQLVLEKWRMNASIQSGQNLGAIVFGGNFTTTPTATTGITYGASIGAIAEGTFSNINTAPTAIVFNTGTVGLGTLALANVTYGTEAARITSNRNLLIGATTETGTASQPLQVTGGAYVSGNLGVGAINPSFKTDVDGDIRVRSSNRMRFGGTTGTTNFFIQYNSTSNSLDFVAG